MSMVANHAPEVLDDVNAQHEDKPRKPRKPRTKKPLEPVSGTVRVLRPLGDVASNVGEIAINDQEYYLARHATGFRLTGFDQQHGTVTVYDLPLNLSSCDCKDAIYREERPGGCKHRKALAALVAKGKL
jgi:hypothetical protein